MEATATPSADQRRHWHRIEITAAVVVAALALTVFVLLESFTDASALIAFLGIVVALDLPICLYIIWRGAREE